MGVRGACLEDCGVRGGDVEDADSRVGEEPDEQDRGVSEPNLGRAESLAAKNEHHDGAGDAHNRTCSERRTGMLLIFLFIQF